MTRSALACRRGPGRWPGRRTARQRAPLTTGTLATEGGLVFAGALDRNFAAYDDSIGKLLWQTRLGGVPTGAPISF